MRNFTTYIKRYVFAGLAMIGSFAAVSQTVPTSVGTDLADGNYVNVALIQNGLFGQYRVQATVNAGIGVRKLEFPESVGSYFNVWRTYTGGTLAAYNNITDPVTQAASARWNNNFGGQGILLPAVIAGDYYTVNISNANGYVNDTIAVLQTNYNPVSVTNVSIPIDTNTINPACSPTIVATLSAAPAAGEYVYLRYSLNGFLDESTVILMSVSGTTATASLPPYPAGTHLEYYVLTSPIAALATSGQGSAYYDCLTLSLKNGGPNSNYRYTVKTLPVPSVYISGTSAVCAGTNDIFTAHGVNNGTVASDYQWYKNGSAVGTNDSIYADATLNDNDSITVVMTANLGCPVNDTSGIRVTVYPKPTFTQSPVLCQGQTITVGNNTYNVTGNHIDTLTGGSVNGCDSIVTTNLIVNPPATALHFNGMNDVHGPIITISDSTNPSFVMVPDAPSLELNGVYTIEAWINLDDANNNAIVDKGDYRFLFETHPNGQTGLGIYNATMGWKYSAGVIPTHTWCHVAVTFDVPNDKGVFYLNGAVLSTFNGISDPGPDNGVMTIGMQQPALCNCNEFDGKMDELRIWNRVLCQTEINAFMNCQLDTTGQVGLVALYHFDQGCINTNNAGVNTLIDASGNGNNGALENFALVGDTSNWSSGTLNTTCSPATVPSVTIFANQSSICAGSGTYVTATPVNAGTPTYQWYQNGAPSGTNSNIYTPAAINDQDSIWVVMANSLNCDTVTSSQVKINVHPNLSTDQTVMLQTGQSVTVASFNTTHTYSTTGTYLDTTGTMFGCDSFITTRLSVFNICDERVINGGFESGAFSPWAIKDTFPMPLISTTSVHTGTYAAFLGSAAGGETPGDASFTQQVLVPAAGGTLSYWYLPYTEDGIDYDWQDAYVTDLNGNILATIMHVCRNGSWVNVKYNMSAFAGQNVRIEFLVHGDNGGDATNMYVDDVTLNTKSSLIQSLVICQGQSVVVGSNTYTTTGSHIDTLVGANSSGCDSIVTTNVLVNALPYDSGYASPATICLGDSSLAIMQADTAGSALYYGFQGPFAPANWTFATTNSDGVVDASNASTSIDITSGNNGSEGSGTTDYTTTISTTGVLTFDWTYNTNDNASEDYPQYILNGTTYPFPGFDLNGSNTQSGSGTIHVNAGDIFTLEAYTVNNLYGPADIIISNLQLSSVNNTIAWYDASTGGTNLGSGDTLHVTPIAGGADTVYAQVTSAAGCVSASRFPVAINVNTPPTFTSIPANFSQGNDPNVCGATVNYASATASGSPAPVITYSQASGTSFAVGTDTVIVTATNSCGTITQNFIITVKDTQAPVLTVPAAISVSNDSGACGAVVTYTAPTATDNCGASGTQTFNYSGAIVNWTVPAGITKIHAVVAGAQGGNGGGLGASIAGDVTVTPGETLQILVGGQGDLVASSSTTGGGGGGGSFLVRGANTPLIVAGGGGGFTTSAGFGGVYDPNISNGQADSTGGSTIGGAGGTNGNGGGAGQSDCCLPGSLGASGGGGFYTDGLTGAYGTPGSAFVNGGGYGVGGNNPTYPGFGGTGNGGFGGGAGAAWDNAVRSGGGGGYSGGEGGQYLNYEFGGGGGSYNIGANQVNTAGANTGNGSITITYGSGGPAVVQTAGLPSGSSFPVGTTTNTYTATDAAGNTTIQSFTVTVKDTSLPTITCPATVTVNTDPGLCTASGVALGSPTTADNCGVASTTNDAPATFPIGNTNVTWTVTDVNGNTNTCVQVVTVNNNNVPSVSVTASPAGTVCAGTPVTFTATPVYGGASPSYQWYDNGTTAGTNSSTYTTSTLANNDSVWVVMTSNGACPTVATATSSSVFASVYPVDTFSQSQAVCAGKAYNYNGHSYTVAGTYVDTLIGAGSNGCDSIVTTTLTITPSSMLTQSITLTNGLSVNVGTHTYSTPGTYQDTISGGAATGCDSIITTNLTIANPACGERIINGDFETQSLFAWTINNTSPTPVVNNQASYTGSYSAFLGDLSNSNEFESLGDASFYQQVTVSPAGGTLSYWYLPYTEDGITYDWQDAYVTDTNGNILTTIMHVCDGSQTWTNITQNMSAYAGQTVRIEFLVHQDGAGDVTNMYVDNVSLISPEASSQSPTICQGRSLTVGTHTYTVQGTYMDTLFGAGSGGCDSIIVTNLTVLKSAINNQSVTICSDKSLTVGIHTYTLPGAYSDTLTNLAANGCDSIVNTDLSVNPVGTLTQSPVICSGQSVTVGSNVHSTQGTFIDTLTNASANGCDSIVTTNLTINPIPTVNATSDQTVCNTGSTATVSFTGSVPGTVYNWTGTDGTIGLATSGSGDIASFTATNSGTVPVVDTIIVTPSYTNGGTTCTGTSDTFTITVNPTPTVNPSFDQELCNGDLSAPVTFTGAVAGTVYNWILTNSNIGLFFAGSGNLPATPASNPGTTPIIDTVIVTPSYTNAGVTCTGTPDTFTVTINPTPTVNASADQTVCNTGSTTAVTFTGAVAGTVYGWTGTDGTIGLATTGYGDIASFTATNNGIVPVVDTIIVTPTYPYGDGLYCTGPSDTFTITVNPTPTVNPTADQTVCNSLSTTTVSFTGTVAGTVYNWTGSDGTIGIATSGTGDIASFTVTNTGATPIVDTVVVTPSYTNAGVTCTGPSDTFTITVNPSPVLVPTADQSVCNNDTTHAVIFTSTLPGGTYAWTSSNASVGLATSGAGGVPSFTATNATTSDVIDTIIVTPTSPLGCVGASDTFTITIHPTPVVALGPNVSQCAGSLQIDAGNPGSTYAWSDGTTTQIDTVSTSGVYYVTVTTQYGCIDSGSKTLYIKPAPSVNLGPDTSYCGGAVTLNAGNPASTFLWSTGATGQFLTVNSTSVYSVIVTDTASGCKGYDTVAITFNIVPQVNLGPDTTMCGGTLTLLAGDPGNIYNWSTGATTTTITVSTTGTYSVTVTYPSGCATTASIHVIIYPKPNLGADVTDSICPFTKASLYNYYQGSGLTMTYPTTATPGSVDPGIYTVVGTNANGCTDTAYVTITYRVKPDLGADKTDSVCPGYTYNLDNLYPNVGYASYTWINTFTETAVGPGTYTLVVTNAGGCSDTAVATIITSQKPNLGGNKTDSVCLHYTYDLQTLYKDSGFASYVWNVANPGAVTAGTYQLVVTNASGCTDTAYATIIYRAQPVVTLAISPNLCSTVPAFQLTGGQPLGGTYYINDIRDSIFSAATLGTGPQRVTYVYTNASGCTDSASTTITIFPQPVITDTATLPILCTNSQAINLDQYFSPSGGSYFGPAISGQYFYPSLAGVGTDSITYIYTDQHGCVDTAGRNITITNSVKVTLHTTVSNFTICNGDSITFFAGGATNYQFFVNDSAVTGMSDTSTFTASSLHNHDQVTVVGSNACSSDTSDFIIIDVNPAPVVNAGPDTTIDLGQSVILQGSATGIGPLTYNWTPNSHLNFPNVPNPTFNGSDTTTFTLMVTDANGCKGSDQVTVNVRVPDNVLLPNIITPNGDGYNDAWVLNPKINLAGSHLVIFNRWGEKVYEADNYANNWKGTYMNTNDKLPDGTYYYVLKVPAQDNHVYEGPINILSSQN